MNTQTWNKYMQDRGQISTTSRRQSPNSKLWTVMQIYFFRKTAGWLGPGLSKQVAQLTFSEIRKALRFVASLFLSASSSQGLSLSLFLSCSHNVLFSLSLSTVCVSRIIIANNECLAVLRIRDMIWCREAQMWCKDSSKVVAEASRTEWCQIRFDANIS